MDNQDESMDILGSDITSQSTQSTHNSQHVQSGQLKYEESFLPLTDEILKSCALDKRPVKPKKKKVSKHKSTLPIIWKGSHLPVIDKVPDTVRNVLLSVVMFSLLFYVLFVLFVLVGAWVYHVHEMEVEEQSLKEYMALRRKAMADLNNIKDAKVAMLAMLATARTATNVTLSIDDAIRLSSLSPKELGDIRVSFREYLANLTILRKNNVGFDAHFGPEDKVPKRVWDYSGGLLYMTGLISTVSYSPLRVQTDTSYTMNLLVVIVGLPLHLALLRNVGFLLSSCVTLCLRVGLPRLLRSRMYTCCVGKLCFCKRQNKEEENQCPKGKPETAKATLTHGGVLSSDIPTVSKPIPATPALSPDKSAHVSWETSVIDIQSKQSTLKTLTIKERRNSWKRVGTAISAVQEFQSHDINGVSIQNSTIMVPSKSIFNSMFRLPAAIEEPSEHSIKDHQKEPTPISSPHRYKASIAASYRSGKSCASAKSGKSHAEHKKTKHGSLMHDPFKLRQDCTPSFETYLKNVGAANGVTSVKQTSNSPSQTRHQNLLFTAVKLKSKMKAKKRHASQKKSTKVHRARGSVQGTSLHTYAGLVETKMTRVGKHGIVHAGQVLPEFIDMKSRFNLSVCRTPDCKLCEVDSPETLLTKETLGLFSYRITEMCISLAVLPVYVLGSAVYFQTTSRPEMSLIEALYFCVSHLILLGSPTYRLPMDLNPTKFRTVAIITYLHIGLFLVAACFQPKPFPNSMLVFGSLRNKFKDLKPGFFVEYLRKQRKADGDCKGTVYVESEFAKYDYSELPGMVSDTKKSMDALKKTKH